VAKLWPLLQRQARRSIQGISLIQRVEFRIIALLGLVRECFSLDLFRRPAPRASPSARIGHPLSRCCRSRSKFSMISCSVLVIVCTSVMAANCRLGCRDRENSLSQGNQ
jgi:hypothetical protein